MQDAGSRSWPHNIRIAIMRSALLVINILLAGCQLLPDATAGPLGGPPVECREVPRDTSSFRDSWRTDPRIEEADVQLVIVQCVVVRCDELEGEVEVRVTLRSGEVLDAGGGGYTSALEPAPASAGESGS